jgi:Tol biopolymer transport system component
MQSQRVLPTSGSTDIAGLPPGDYSLRLSDIANNCSAARSVFSAVTLQAGQVTPVSFDLACAATKQIAYTTTTGSGSKIRVVRSNAADNLELTSQGSNLDPDWSPDGTRIVFTSDRDGRREIYLMDSVGGNVVRLTNVAGSNYRPAWSADGKKISFVSERDGHAQIYVMDADGDNQVRLTNVGGNDAPSWSPDGRQIAFQSDRDGSQRIWIMNSDGSAPVPLAGSINGDRQPAWSPDGKKIAFSRTPSLVFRDIYMLDIDGSNLTQISFNYPDASDPGWAPDGLQLAFSATYCTGDFYSYYGTCEVGILLARTDGRILPATPFLAAGYNPAWHR